MKIRLLHNTIMAIGDSITVNGHTVPGLASVNGVVNRFGGACDGPAQSRGYLFWASLFSQGRLSFTGVAATGGYTTADIIAQHLETILRMRPALCVVLAGTNDVLAGLPLATWSQQVTTIYAGLLKAGVLPVACTLPPAHDLEGAHERIADYNFWILQTAERMGLPVVEFHEELVGPAGRFADGMSDDGVHPSTAGAHVMGQLLWKRLAPIVPIEPCLLDGPSERETLLGNACLLKDANRDGVPDLWITEGSPKVTLAPETGFDRHAGNAWTLTRMASDAFAKSVDVGPLEPGSRLWFSVTFQTSGVQQAAGGIDVRLASADLRHDLYSMVNFAPQDGLTNPVYAMSGEIQVPLACVADRLAVHLRVRKGGALRIAEPTLVKIGTG